MRIGLSEKQYNTILLHVSENKEITEDDEVPAAEPEAGTSSKQSGGQGYPEVGKWESGVTRGPANQVGVTKWSDVVGSTLKRGKANQLKEQQVEGEYSLWSGTPTKTYLTVWGEEMKIPNDGTIKITLWKDEDDRQRIFASNKNYKEDGKWLSKDGKTEIQKPSKEYMELIIPTGTIRYIDVINENVRYATSIMRKGDGMWNTIPSYINYDNRKPYDWEEYVTRGFKQWWSDNWELVLTIVASAVAGILTGGASLWVQAAAQGLAGIGVASFAYLQTPESERDNVGYAINVIISFVPFTSAAAKIGVRAPLKGLSKIAPKLNSATTMDEVFDAIKGLSKSEQILATRMIQQVPKEFNREFKTKMMEGFVKSVRSGEIKLSKIPFKERMWWKQMAAETGIQFTVATTLSLPDMRSWLEQTLKMVTISKEELENSKKEDEITKQNIEKLAEIEKKAKFIREKYENISNEIYNDKFSPILSEYEDLKVSNSLDDRLKFLNILETVIIEYNKNPKSDLSLIVKTKYGKNG